MSRYRWAGGNSANPRAVAGKLLLARPINPFWAARLSLLLKEVPRWGPSAQVDDSRQLMQAFFASAWGLRLVPKSHIGIRV